MVAGGRRREGGTSGDVVAADRHPMKSQNLRFPAFALSSSFGYLNVHKLFENPDDATNS